MILRPPAELPSELVAACLAASRDIRLHRTTVLSHRARLGAPACQLFIDPIRHISSRLAVAFTYSESHRELEGVLTIEGLTDPLPVALYQSSLSPLSANAWAAVLLGFRDISMPESSHRDPPPTFTRTRHRLPGQHTTAAELAAVRRRRAPSTPAAPDHWSSTLTLHPSPHSPHWVVGHKRVLPRGQEASEKKLAEAARYGITLHHGETWVSPHARGAAPDAVMVFRWEAPDALDRAIRLRPRAAA